MRVASGRAQAVLAGLLSALQVAMVSAHACTLPDKGIERGWKQALAESDEVFVAELHQFHETAPPPGAGPYYLNQVQYELVETLKGRPDPSGVLSEANPYRPVERQTDVVACGPFLVHPGREGRTARVFARRERLPDHEILWVHDSSELLDPGNPDARKALAFVGASQSRNEEAP